MDESASRGVAIGGRIGRGAGGDENNPVGKILMLVELRIPVDANTFALNGRTVDEAVDEANAALAREAKSHFGAGRVTIGRLADGRWFFRHITMGTMVQIPPEFAERAKAALAHSVLPAVRIHPALGADPIPQVHGIWARQSWVDTFLARERATLETTSKEIDYVE